MRPDFLTSPPENDILLFNLACFYANYGEKTNLLKATDLAIAQGKKPWQFMIDPDFEAYRCDEDFIRVLNNRTVSYGSKDDTPYCKLELIISLSTGDSLYLDERYVGRDLHDSAMPLYELLKPKHIEVSLYFMMNNSGTALISKVTVNNLSDFLHELKKSKEIPVGTTQIIPTLNNNFSFGIWRLALNKVMLFNPYHVVDSDAGIYDNSYIIETESYTQEVMRLVTSYNCLQNILNSHIQRYVTDPDFGQAHNGLRIGYRGNRLVPYIKGKRLFHVVIENISDKPIHLLDNITVSDGHNYREVFNLSSKPDEKLIGEPEIVLSPNEILTFKIRGNPGFTNRIKLKFRSSNSYPMMCNGQQKTRLDATADKHFSHIWNGKISHEVFVFTVDRKWLKETKNINDFNKCIQAFKPDFI